MSEFSPRSERFKERITESFARQGAMQLFKATIEDISPGRVTLMMPYIKEATQQHGFLHAGSIATVLDSACGYAAFSLMDDEAGVLTIEYKVNLLAPAKGERFRLVGQVVKPGKTITVVEGKAYAIEDGAEKLVSTMTATVMAVRDKAGVKD